MLPPFQVASTASATPMNKGIQRMGGSVEATCDITLLLRNMCHQRKKVCRNSPKLKITLATESCNEGDFDKREVLIHPHLFSLFSSFINLLV